MSDELELLRRWRAGDKAAGEALARTHYREIFERLRREVGGNAELAADLTQQVFEAAVCNLDDIVTDFRRYLHGTARFKLWEHFRRRPAPGGELDPESSRLLDPGRGVISVLVGAEDSSLLVAALRSLSTEEQGYLMWFYADRLTHPQIAQRMGLTAAQVNGRIHRAREKLRRQLEALARSPEQGSAADQGFDTWMASLRLRVAVAVAEVDGLGEHP
jgi:RNA polymerase sigma factor (sigma-70 family)